MKLGRAICFLSDTSQNTNLQSAAITELSTATDPFNTFSKLKVNNMVIDDKEIVKNDFVNASTLINKAKKKARETDLYLKKLNEKVLPRCQSADITSDIVKRNILNADIPLKITRRFQPGFKHKLVKNIQSNIENPKIISKPRSTSQEKRVHFYNSSGKLSKTNYSYPFNDAPNSSPDPLLKEDSQNNVSITNVNFEANNSDGKYTNDCKVDKLTVQRIPCVNLKPDLVTQKLANIQIKPDNKKLLSNHTPNVAYQEFAFGLEPETCKCHSMVQPKISNDKIVARHQIRKILCGMLDNTSSNYPQSDRLISQLQTIIIKLEETNSLDYNDSSEVEGLIEEHSMVGFSEEVIKRRLLEIAEKIVENDNDDNDGISFDQMSVEIENNSRQVLERLTRIKNSIVALNPSVEFPNFSVDSKIDEAAKHVDEKLTNNHSNNIFYSKNHYDNIPPTTECVSIKDFLRHGCDFSSLQIFKNASVIKEYGSQITQCSKDNVYQNQNRFRTHNTLNNHNNTAQLKEHQIKSKNEEQNLSTLFEDSISLSSQPRSSHSNDILKHQQKPTEDENQNNNKNDFTTNGYDWEVDNSLKINSGKKFRVCETNNDMILTKSDQLTISGLDKNTDINLNIGNLPINDKIKDYDNLKSNIEEWQSSSLSFTSSTSNLVKQSSKVKIIDKRTLSSSASTTSSMISSKQSTQEVESEAETLTSLGEVDYFKFNP